MITVGDVLKFMNTLAPASMKMHWDNVGLLCGSRTAPVTRVLVALDPFEGVCREAETVGAQLIVTHHPLIFTAPKSITDETSVGRSIMQLCRSGISAINAHTNLDQAPDGVNQILAQILGLEEIQVIDAQGEDEQGRSWGLLRSGTATEQSLETFLSHVKRTLNCSGLRFVNSGKKVHRVAVGGGACASELLDAFHAGCDTFVTSDVKYNQFWDAFDLGMNLIDAGHFATENPVVAVLAERLQAAFPEIEVILSKSHGDCVKFF